MDYPNRRRLKLDGTGEVVPLEAEPALRDQLLQADPGAAAVERLFRIHVEAFDWNCPQFITPRLSAAEVESAKLPLRQRIAELEAEVGRLRSLEQDRESADGS
jgi:hypothetical protein